MNSSEAPGRIKRISPTLAVADMDETIDFYTGVLGFEVSMKSPGYSVIERDGATLHLTKAADESVMNAVRGRTQIYIEVDDITFLWKQVQAFKGKYPIRDLFDQPYGMTEFHVGDPNGCLVLVGQKTGRA